MTKVERSQGLVIVVLISVVYGLASIPMGLLIAGKSTGAGFVPLIFAAFRSCALITLVVAAFSTLVFVVLGILDRRTFRPHQPQVRYALLIASGIFVISFFLIFDRFYNKFQAFLVTEIIGGLAALVVGIISYLLLRSRDRLGRLQNISSGLALFGVLTVLALWGITLLSPARATRATAPGPHSSRVDRPNILLIVLDTVRADHMSVYGYPTQTTPFLEKMALESAIFTNAYAASPWTLPSHATIFTGLYPSQHRTHEEHMWLDDSFRTLAERLTDHGYQTVCFSNNDYVSAYHNLVQGFERTWYKGSWTDADQPQFSGLGRPVVSFYYWLRDYVQRSILTKIAKNPVSHLAYPNAALTNQAIAQWLGRARDKDRPFFIFVNYMDAHLPYNPDEATARLFLNKDELAASYSQRLRFPPIEYCLDVSKGGYSKSEIHVINALYDACIRQLDGELEKLDQELRRLGLADNTLLIITSDHGEYLGERNRFAHGLGLHDEVLHIPLMVRYLPRFEPNTRNETVVTHVDIPETILTLAEIGERPPGLPETQRLFRLKEEARRFVFAELFFPVHLLIDASLRDDNSGLCVEQKTMHSRALQLIWKSRGELELYDVISDPREVHNLYSKDNPTAQAMLQHLTDWANSLYIPPAQRDSPESPKIENLKLKERLRALGYVR